MGVALGVAEGAFCVCSMPLNTKVNCATLLSDLGGVQEYMHTRGVNSGNYI